VWECGIPDLIAQNSWNAQAFTCRGLFCGACTLVTVFRLSSHKNCMLRDYAVGTRKESRTLRSEGPFFFHSSAEAAISST